jgi:hypothetical protein
MKRPKTIQILLALAAMALWAAGCASPNVNPPQARANTGYVDLRADSTNELCWEVGQFDQAKGEFRRVFSSLEPPTGGILRLAFAPGRYKLRVTFLNFAIVRPAELEVEVQDGKITPVRVVLTDTGDSFVNSKKTTVGGTAYGRYGRRTKFDSDNADLFEVAAQPEAPVPYQVKEQITYKR